MTLLALANELLLLIAETLESEKDINAVVQTNHRLYALLNPYLYQHNRRHSGSSALRWAATAGQVSTVRRILEQKYEIESRSAKVQLDCEHLMIVANLVDSINQPIENLN
ncbi:hypothetical protein BO70DRAFT_395872 [Aspergillus heteromorphus CBS 117.55]|uniref:Uncharacterized protein n=1 Tax=Aspergillus heteromorphus CBS 117.55 TaxID=1448321 RepID=A0A317WA48_9EURO|nr:uncharacterized protein BO70DRAFT_395872 [Aspergillus heteromorphus CBS 117.55]PWY83426.1 hypothetical protein BO70DRAFT_395872 [Aspergillus heteromorphus CBS 117.55]